MGARVSVSMLVTFALAACLHCSALTARLPVSPAMAAFLLACMCRCNHSHAPAALQTWQLGLA